MNMFSRYVFIDHGLDAKKWVELVMITKIIFEFFLWKLRLKIFFDLKFITFTLHTVVKINHILEIQFVTLALINFYFVAFIGQKVEVFLFFRKAENWRIKKCISVGM